MRRNRQYFIAWVTPTLRAGSFVVWSNKKGEDLVRNMVSIARTYDPTAIVLSINKLP